MADVYVSHADSDRWPIEDLLGSLRDAGYSYSAEVKGAKLVLVCWSRQSAGSARAQEELRLALEAWEADRLLLVRLDASPLPLGLRDIDHLDISEATYRTGLAQIIDAVRARLGPARASSPPGPAPNAPPPRAWSVAPTGVAFALLFVSMLGLLAWVLLAPPRYPSLSVPPRSEPAPAVPAPPPGLAPPIPAAPEVGTPDRAAVKHLSITIGGVAVALLLTGAMAVWQWRRRSSSPSAMPAQGQEVGTDASSPAMLFVSYSRDDGPTVTGLVDALERCGLRTWLDTRHEGGTERFAGPIVQAIRGSQACAFMCSSTAYDSDHVVRELYLADKYRKPMIPVEIERATPTVDFEYFFSGLDFVPAQPAERCVRAIVQRLDEARRAVSGRAQAA